MNKKSLLDEIEIRELSQSDIGNARRFQQFINEVIEEDVEITLNKRKTLFEEEAFLRAELSLILRKMAVFLVAEHGQKIAGVCSAELGLEKKSHVAELGIIIHRDYRGIGLGRRLMEKTMELAVERLKPVMFRLSVFETNKRAQQLYGKLGFEEVARVPCQYKHKDKLVDEIIMIRWVNDIKSTV